MRRATVIRKFAASYPWFWRLVRSFPPSRRTFNRLYINVVANASRPRPHPMSLWGPTHPGPCADQISWTGLVDRSYTGRHLPPADDAYVAALPPVKALDALFRRKGPMLPCPKSSALFGFFAQWFTDSFLRTDPDDVRKNTSNHEIDLCQIYGLNAADTSLLRSGKHGELKSQAINGEEYPPCLFEPDGVRVRGEFLGLSYIDPGRADFRRDDVLPDGFNTPARKATLFASGLERGNSTILYSAINTIFLREHNRLCRELARAHPDWANDGKGRFDDRLFDHRLFETARNVNIAQLLKVIIEDYINHISPAHFKLFLDVGFAEKQKWYRSNRICAEFNLLYRWHQLVPAELTVKGGKVADQQFRFNNPLLVTEGIEAIIDAASSQAAGRIALKNTAGFLVDADLAAIEKSRAWRIKPYTAYLEAFDLPAVTSFEQLTGDPVLAAELRAAYRNDINLVEFPVGLLAERRSGGAMLGDLMTAMVAVDAFSQALTNPLLSENVYGEKSFAALGMRCIENTSSFSDIVRRNAHMGDGRVSFALQKVSGRQVPGSYGPPIFGVLRDTADVFLVSGVEKFFRRRQRKHGSTVFKVNLFQPTIAMLDHRAISSLFASNDLVQEQPSHGFQFQIPPLPLVGNVAPSMFGSGDAHDLPKEVYLQLLQQRSATLVSTFDATMQEFAARWLSLGQFSFRDELEDFVVTFMFQWILGASPEPKEVRELYSGIFSHWSIGLTKYVPGSAYRRSLGIYERLLAFVKGAPLFPDILALARPQGLDDETIAKHMTFVLGMNSFLGNQSLLKSTIGELSLRPDCCEALRQEMSVVLGPERGGDLRALLGGALPRLDRTLREILRLHPPVFFIYGRATRDRVIESAGGNFALDQGDLVLGVIPMAHRDSAVFARPDEFNPDRFQDVAASQHLIWPRGLYDHAVSARDRTCPGRDWAVVIAKLFCIALLPNYVWELKARPEWGQRFTLNVAAPKGALLVSSFRRRGEAIPVQADAAIMPGGSRKVAA